MKEILSLPHNKLLFTTGHYACYLTDSASIPLMMHELGRRREESFRAIGEGTGKPLDLDGYDEYYKKINWKTVRLVYYPFPIRGAFL